MFAQTSTALLLRLAITAVLLAALSQAMGATGKQHAKPHAKPHADACAALAKELATLDSKMRAGYGGKAGEQLRDRQREATDEFHRRRCRWQ